MGRDQAPPSRAQLLAQLRSLTKILEAHGAAAEKMAPILAARGFPPAVMGDGAPRGESELTSTERAAAYPGPWDGVDEKLVRWYVATFAVVTMGQQLLVDLASHAAPDDPDMQRAAGPGAGWCLACERWVVGSHGDRLRAGFCDACRKAFTRLPAPRDRAKFIRDRPKVDDALRRPRRHEVGTDEDGG